MDIRYRIVEDDSFDMEDMKGDMFDPRCNSDISAEELRAQEIVYENHLMSNGVWGYVIEIRCACCGEWKHEDSCWGFDDYSFAEKSAKESMVDIESSYID